MANNSLIDFYRGWMIEISQSEIGFAYLCCSPVGKQLSGAAPYEQEFAAQQAAIRCIDYAFACHALNQMLREAYELDQLSFDEWQSLSHALTPLPQALN